MKRREVGKGDQGMNGKGLANKQAMSQYNFIGSDCFISKQANTEPILSPKRSSPGALGETSKLRGLPIIEWLIGRTFRFG